MAKVISLEDKKRSIRQGVLAKYAAERGYKRFPKMGLWKCERTAYNREAKPEMLTIAELDMMKLSDAEIIQLVRGK